MQMASRKSIEPISFESSRDSIIAHVTADSQNGRPKSRRYPFLSLLSVLLVLLSSGSGIALFIVIAVLKLESPGDFASRVLLLVASCMSIAYVALHLAASRKTYVKNHGSRSPQIYGHYVVALALLLARLSLPVWIAAIVTTAVIAAKTGLDGSRGVQGNMPWLNLLASVSALLSSIAVMAVVESSDRPFATAIISRQSFISGRVSPANNDVEERSASRGPVPATPEMKKPAPPSRRKSVLRKSRIRDQDLEKEVLRTPDIFAANTMRQSRQDSFGLMADSPGRRHRARSQSVPAPLSAIFASRPLQEVTSSPNLKGAFAWRPPTRDLSSLRRSGVTSFDQVSIASRDDDEISLLARTSDVSSIDRRPTLPVIPPPMARSRDSVLVKAADLDTRRWTAIGLESPSVDMAFVAVPLPAVKPRNSAIRPRPLSRSVTVSGRMTNFSRPRTAAAAVTQMNAEKGPQGSTGEEPNVPRTAPDRPRTAAAAIMQAKVGKRLQAAQRQEVAAKTKTPRPAPSRNASKASDDGREMEARMHSRVKRAQRQRQTEDWIAQSEARGGSRNMQILGDFPRPPTGTARTSFSDTQSR